MAICFKHLWKEQNSACSGKPVTIGLDLGMEIHTLSPTDMNLSLIFKCADHLWAPVHVKCSSRRFSTFESQESNPTLMEVNGNLTYDFLGPRFRSQSLIPKLNKMRMSLFRLWFFKNMSKCFISASLELTLCSWVLYLQLNYADTDKSLHNRTAMYPTRYSSRLKNILEPSCPSACKLS